MNDRQPEFIGSCIQRILRSSCAICVLLVVVGCAPEVPVPTIGNPGIPTVLTDDNTKKPSAAERAERSLRDSNWLPGAAAQVAQLNANWFEVLATEAHDEFDKELRTLGALGNHEAVMDVVQLHPEVAGLLATSKDPEQLASVLRYEADYERVIGFFQAQPQRDDASDLTKALSEHRDVLCRLSAKGFAGSEALFLFDHSQPGRAEYARWLNEQFDSRLSGSDARLESFLLFVLAQGEDLRESMRRDQQFREDFPKKLWPQFQRMIARQDSKENQLSFESLCWDPNVWRLLTLPDGEAILDRWGLLPCDLFFGKDQVEDELRPALTQVLLVGDNETLQAIFDYHRHPDFRHLILRPGLSRERRAAAFNQVRMAGPNWQTKLGYFRGLNAAALAEEVGPAPDGPITWVPLYYTLYEVPKKLIQGREATGLDILIAVVDPVTLFMGPLGPDDVLKVVGKEGVKAAERAEAAAAIRTTLRNGAQSAAKRQLGKAAERLGEKELGPWAVSQWFQQSRTAMARKLSQHLTVDVTGPVQMMFKGSGLGRESFKRLTKLEARLFMRHDAKVLVRLDAVPGSHFAGKFFQETAESAIVGAAIESQPGREAVQAGVKAATPVVEAAERQLRAWRQNVSAWFLASGTDFVDQFPTEQKAK